MDHLLQIGGEILHRLFTREFLTEIAAIALAFGLAWILRKLVRGWLRRGATPRTAPTTLLGRLKEGVIVVSPFLVAWLLLLLMRSVLDAIHLATDFSDLTLRLVGALMLIRLGAYLLRISLGSQGWLVGWESRLTFFFWAIVAINMLGWLDPVIDWLDSVGFGKGANRFTVWSIVKSLVIVTLFIICGTWTARWIERRLMGVQGLAASTRIGISKFFYSVLVGLSILLGLSASGLDLTTLTVFAGAIGVGLGFGLQFIAANLVSGFALLMDRSIKPGDVISFTGMGGTSTEGFGWVQELRGRYVVVRDRDGVETLVPNQSFINNPVINWSYTDPKVRLKLPVRISYEDDAELALKVLLEAAEGQRRILRDPPPVSRLMGFNDYGMDLELRFWISDPQEGVNNIRSEVNRAIWRLFKEHGITIPVARRDVRLVTLPALPGEPPSSDRTPPSIP